MKWPFAWSVDVSPLLVQDELLSGGANEAVIRMLISIGSPSNVPAFIEAVKKREKVLSGFGHR